MTEHELQYRRFKVVRSIAGEQIAKKQVYFNTEELLKRLNNSGGLDDAKVLLRMFERELNVHNSKLSAKITRIDNLSYMDKNVYKSKALKGIKFDLYQIDRAIMDNPEADTWEIAKQLINE